MRSLSALMVMALATSLRGVTGLEVMTPRGTSTDKLALYLFEKNIVSKVCLSQFIKEYYEFHGIKLTRVSAQQVLNRLQSSGMLIKSFDSKLKDFKYTLNNTQEII